MTKRHLVIATRKSPLALIQAEIVKTSLMKIHSHLSVEILGTTTQADKKLDLMLTTIGGKGLFVKELEEALLDGRADIAVHSMKDVPMSMPPDLVIDVICERVDPRDVFVSNQYQSLSQLPTGASVGTSSLRRETQLKALRADINFNFLRGNINTRLSKLDNGDFAAIILACAGLKRLHLTDRASDYFSTEECLPAAGQGALGIQCRSGDDKVISLIRPLNHETTSLCVRAERAMCEVLNGGCQAPIAAFAEIHHDVLTLRGLVANRNGSRILRAKLEGEKKHAREIGLRVAEVLVQQGAIALLRDFL